MVISGALLPLVALAAYQAAVFGSPFATPYEFRVDAPQHAAGFLGLGVPDLGALKDLLDSEYRGFFVYGGAAAVGFFTCWVWGFWDNPWGDGSRQMFGRVAIGLWMALWILNSGMADWWAGSGWGPRYLLPAVPFLSLGVAPVVEWLWPQPDWRPWLVATALGLFCFGPVLIGVLGGPAPWQDRAPMHSSLLRAIDEAGAPPIVQTMASAKSPVAEWFGEEGTGARSVLTRVASHAGGWIVLGLLLRWLWRSPPRTAVAAGP